MEIKKPKITGTVNCIFCNTECNAGDEFVTTRRKDILWFHKKCYDKNKAYYNEQVQ